MIAKILYLLPVVSEIDLERAWLPVASVAPQDFLGDCLEQDRGDRPGFIAVQP